MTDLLVPVLTLTVANSVNLSSSLWLPQPPLPHLTSADNKPCLFWLFLRIDPCYEVYVTRCCPGLGQSWNVGSVLFWNVPYSEMAPTQLRQLLLQSTLLLPLTGARDLKIMWKKKKKRNYRHNDVYRFIFYVSDTLESSFHAKNVYPLCEEWGLW